MFISFFCSKLFIWVPVSFPSLLVPCTFSFISLFLPFCNHIQPILWASWLPVFWTLHLIGWLCLHCLVLFLEFWSLLSLGPYFFVSVCLLCSKGQRLRYLPGQSNPCHCVVVLYVGEVSQRDQCHLLSSWLAFSHFPCYPEANWVLLVLILGWVGLCTFQDPMGLSNKLSCEAGSFSCHHNPHRFLQSGVLKLYFPTLETQVTQSVSLPSCSSWFIRTQIWASQVLSCPSSPLASALLHVLSAPAAHLCPSYWMIVSSLTPWLSELHTVQFSGSSGCFLFFNLLSFFWLCKEVKCIYLCLHLGWKFHFSLLIKRVSWKWNIRLLLGYITYHLLRSWAIRIKHPPRFNPCLCLLGLVVTGSTNASFSGFNVAFSWACEDRRRKGGKGGRRKEEERESKSLMVSLLIGILILLYQGPTLMTSQRPYFQIWSHWG